MEFISSEYNIGEYHIDDVKNNNLPIKIEEHNTILSGKIKNSLNTSELVLYKFDENHELIEIDRTITDSQGNYRFKELLIGQYLIKDSSFDPIDLNINQRVLNADTNNRIPFRDSYNVANGYLQNGARLNGTKDKVMYIGGRDNGSACLYVYVVQDGRCNMEVSYIGASKNFKIDVNGKSTEEIYTTGTSYFGRVNVPLTLKNGYNLIKFCGDATNPGPTLGVFTLTPTNQVQTKYNLINGILENGARVNNARDMVIRLGGRNHGTAKITVNVSADDYYLINIKFRCGLRTFLVDINGRSTGKFYTVQSEAEGRFCFQVYLNRTSEIKFYGVGEKPAPNLGEFEIISIERPTKPPVKPIPIPVDPKPTPPKQTYDVSKCRLDHQALYQRGYITYLGGHNEGTATIDVDIQVPGSYKLKIAYIYGGRPLKIDINGVYTGDIYYTPRIDGELSVIINLISGKNTIKFYGIESQHASFLSNFTLEFDQLTPSDPPEPPPPLPPPPPPTPTPPPPPPPVEGDSVTKGILENGAKLSNDRRFVLYLGGSNNGSSTVEVIVDKSGKYNIIVDFQNGYRPLKLDINGVYDKGLYTTPVGHTGQFKTVIDLNRGKNKIKFYGVEDQHASNLGKFTLEFIEIPVAPILPAGTYDSATGIFENGAELDVGTNFVTHLGGINNGSTRLTINVASSGTYRIEIKYLAADANINLRVDVDVRTAGIYTPAVTRGWALNDVKTFPFEVSLRSGNNELKFYGDGVNPAPMLGTFTVTEVPKPPQVRDYTFRTLNSLSYTDLVGIIKTIRWHDVPGLFDFSADSYAFFNDDNRVQAIINGLQESGRLFTSQNEQGIDTLVEFLRAGFYIAHNNTQLSRLYEISYRNKCWPAIKAVLSNPNFRLGTAVQDKVVTAIGKLLGNASADVEIVNSLAPVLRQYKDNITRFSSQSDKNSAIYKVAHETNFFLEKEVTRMGNDAGRTIFYSRIEDFTLAIEALAEVGVRASADIEWLVSTFLDVTNDLARFRRQTSTTLRVLTTCLRTSRKSSTLYLQIAGEIKNRFNSRLSDGSNLNYSQIIEEAKRANLPNTYTFDSGETIIKTGDRVPVNTIKKLYWASKEVKSQFVRVVGNDRPLDVNHRDDILTMIIYNSPDHYKINYQLYGYSTDNGGIYQEEIGTFFTYDREVPRESIYSLEELFRHEYVHYLQGRFLVKGLWGSGNFFRGNYSRLSWFTEGTAEFFAGSTRKQGIKARRTMVQRLSDDRGNTMSLSTLFSSSSGFNFYRYGFAFAYYMYAKNKGQFIAFSNYIKADDVAGYENYVQNLKSDSTTNASYNQTIDELIQNLGNLTIPSASDNYLRIHSYLTVTQISSDISSLINLTGITTETKNSDGFETVIIRGSYDNGLSIDDVSDWNSINSKLNRTLTELERKGWSGYSTFTTYFTDYAVDRFSHATYTIVFHGILRTL